MISINQYFNQIYSLNAECDDLKNVVFKEKKFKKMVITKVKPEVLDEISMIIKTKEQDESETKKEPEVGFFRKYVNKKTKI